MIRRVHAFVILSFMLLGISTHVLAQCTPSSAATSPGFRAPDNSLRMPDGTINVAYSQSITINVPDTVNVFGTMIPVDSLKVTSITNFPAGISASAADKAVYYGGDKGCALVSGTTSVAWLDTINIAYTAYITVLGSPQTAPLTWDSIVLKIGDPASIQDLDPARFGISQNYPNPVIEQTSIFYNTPSPVEVEFTVYDMIGKEVYSRVYHSRAGMNTINFVPKGLKPGVYVYTINNGEKALTRRMLLAGK
ncbi:MAG: T9SS type A sorting domain-containing protein [Flavobacteriales bacterium]|nr:T9SS type A sorting domain-containing protein [Flavobacteriales bacterium]